MTGSPEKSSIKKESVRKLIERYGARQVFRILASGILPPEQPDPSLAPEIGMESRKIKISARNLRRMRASYSGPITLPSQEMARKLLKRWRNEAGS
jgi:hypothetical protein